MSNTCVRSQPSQQELSAQLAIESCKKIPPCRIFAYKLSKITYLNLAAKKKKNLSQRVCYIWELLTFERQIKEKNSNLEESIPIHFECLVLHACMTYPLHFLPYKTVSHGFGHSTQSQRHTKLLLSIRQNCNTHQCSFRLSSTTECRTSSICAWQVETGDPELLSYWHLVSQGWEQATHFKDKGAGKKREKRTWNACQRSEDKEFHSEVIILRGKCLSHKHVLKCSPTHFVLVD